MWLRPIAMLQICECHHGFLLFCLIWSKAELMGFREWWASGYVSLFSALIAPIVALLHLLLITLAIAASSILNSYLQGLLLNSMGGLGFKEDWLKDLNWLLRFSCLKIVLHEVCLKQGSKLFFSIVYLEFRYLSWRLVYFLLGYSSGIIYRWSSSGSCCLRSDDRLLISMKILS